MSQARDLAELSGSESDDEFDYSGTRVDNPPTSRTPDAATVAPSNADGDTRADDETRHEKTAPVNENADDLIREHRDRRENLQRWRDEDKKLKNEKLQEKLNERLKQKL